MCAACDVLQPQLEEALFSLALDGSERVGRDKILVSWDRSLAARANEDAHAHRAALEEQRRAAKRKIEEVIARDKTSTRQKREKLLRVLSRTALAGEGFFPST